MSTKTASSQGPALILALGLSLATLLGVASLARADLAANSAPKTVVQTANVPGTPQNREAPKNFVCHAGPGGWCDLRDWGGMDHWKVTSPSPVLN